ncbi:MAG: hypothetical protein HYZ75_02260 [Elusimicrobia bacterium]|nr:hypothetical protein [Elusimicrobiota bacterium]
MRIFIGFFLFWSAYASAQNVEWDMPGPAPRLLTPDRNQEKPRPIAGTAVDDSLEEARRGLAVLKQKYTLPYAAALDAPIKRGYINSDKLIQYDQKDELKDLLNPDQQSKIYPVTFQGVVLAGVILFKKDGKWAFDELGASFSSGEGLANKIYSARKNRAESLKIPMDSFSIIDVPALGATFLAEPADPVTKETRLTPIYLHPTLPLKMDAGTKPAGEVLTILAAHIKGIINSEEYRALRARIGGADTKRP